MKLRLFFLFALLQPQAHVIASEVIDELTVISQNTENRAMKITTLIDKKELDKNAPTVLSDIFLNKPIIGMRSNSRGETVLRFRGSDERQTAIFLDGASLSIPWDGRIDLGLLPVGMIDFVNISKGAVPIEYGSNAMLGAVEILSFNDCENRACSFKGEYGSNGMQSYNVANAKAIDDYQLTFAGSYRKRNNFSYSEREVIPFAPVNGNERINTDSESFSSWLSIGRQLESTSFKLSYLLVDAKKGVPPAGHIDPNKKKPRYWRYPEWKLEQTTFNLIHNVNNNTFIKMASWFQGFTQDIDQFSDMTYKLLEITKNDKDNTKGLRVILNTDRQQFSARFVGNYQSTKHFQQEKEPQSLSTLSGLKYSQDLFSLGAEIDISVSEELQVSLGSSYDKFKTPETGGRNSQPNLSNWASNLILEWHLDSNFYASLSIGDRVRFPTLRELYGVALEKFIINPNLKPESAVITDLSFSWQLDNLPLSINTTFWSTKINDAISKKQILENGKWFDQRYNIAGSRGKGFSFDTIYSVSDKMQIQLNGNLQSHEAEIGQDGLRPPILLRPETQLNLVTDYKWSDQFSIRLSLQRISGSLDEDVGGKLVTLQSSNRIDMNFFVNINDSWKMYIALNNLNDTLILPQLGFPGIGREYRIGFERLL